MREELKQGNKSIFSIKLYEQIRACLDEGRQVILFLNRRGYSTFLSCRSCGYVMRCEECGISMTYHKARGEVVCHYCGRRTKIPDVCPACGSKYIRHFGTGTEKVEEIAGKTFPDAVIERLDLDTAKRRGSIDAILSRFGKGKTDILIGTQLVAKGLDFSNVGLVGIVAADISLNIPDFRSSERTFQLITQAAGRAGRGTVPGKVVIQSYTPDHYAIQLAARQDYDLFYEAEIKIREQVGYPPFCDILYIILAAETEEEASGGAEKIRQSFLRRVGRDHAVNVLGPRPAPINKASGLYRYQLLIKCTEENWDAYREALWKIKNKVVREKQKEWTLSIDVNPYGFL
jgi:primosomal protein N' (replication factor Y)